MASKPPFPKANPSVLWWDGQVLPGCAAHLPPAELHSQRQMAGDELPLQMLIFWPAVKNIQGIISLQSPSALPLLGGTKLKGRELTAREMQESAWPCLFHVFLGQRDAGIILADGA